MTKFMRAQIMTHTQFSYLFFTSLENILGKKNFSLTMNKLTESHEDLTVDTTNIFNFDRKNSCGRSSLERTCGTTEF